MQCNDRYIETLKALNELYDFLNREFFESELSTPVITIQQDDKSPIGWFTRWESWLGDEIKSYPEINVSANYLDREPIEIAASLLHNMCHQYAYKFQIKDWSRNSAYHNSRFREIAERHGLLVKKTDENGWSDTSLTESAMRIVRLELSSFPLLKRSESPFMKKSKTLENIVVQIVALQLRLQNGLHHMRNLRRDNEVGRLIILILRCKIRFDTILVLRCV